LSRFDAGRLIRPGLTGKTAIRCGRSPDTICFRVRDAGVAREIKAIGDPAIGATPGPPAAVSLGRLFNVFLYIGATSFGGGVVAYLRDHLVQRQRWLTDDQFLAALEIGETVPGLISTNVSVIVGSRLRGVRGSVAATIGMTLPGAIAVFVLGLLYARFRSNPEVKAVLTGVSAAAVGLILAVTLQIGRREVTKWLDLAILIPTFVLVGMLHISLLPTLVMIAPIAIWIHRPNRAAQTDYHSRQAAYHAQLAAHHTQVATTAESPIERGS
jgi:chromate transporter